MNINILNVPKYNDGCMYQATLEQHLFIYSTMLFQSLRRIEVKVNLPEFRFIHFLCISIVSFINLRRPRASQCVTLISYIQAGSVFS